MNSAPFNPPGVQRCRTPGSFVALAGLALVAGCGGASSNVVIVDQDIIQVCVAVEQFDQTVVLNCQEILAAPLATPTRTHTTDEEEPS